MYLCTFNVAENAKREETRAAAQAWLDGKDDAQASAEAAEALLVSESAIRRRMRDTGILFAIRTCPKCGFDRIPPAADYCRMCGQSLQANPHPPAEQAVRYLPPPPEECPVCGLKETGAPEGRCMNCDNPKLNHCLPEYDQAQHWCPADALFCETCGARTLYSELLAR